MSTHPQSASHNGHAVAHTSVTLSDRFWQPRQRVNREQTIPHIYEQLRKTGRIDALRGIWDPEVVARGVGGHNIATLFWDSDVAKWLEAASYSLANNPDSALDQLVDQVIDVVAQAQQSDGYLNSWFVNNAPEKRWTNLRDWHELYDAGHLIEAGVAHFNATGKRTLLDVVSRYADAIGAAFGPNPGQRRGYCGHPEIELALVRLAHATAEQRYLDMARYFIDVRGQQPHYFDQESRERGEEPSSFRNSRSYEYNQSHRPVRQQDEVVGHAVRAAYLYSAMADLAAEDGDETLLAACRTLWHHLTTRRMYVMGGIGTSGHNEGFTSDYDLPNESAYAETCAAIALVFWAQRMLLIDQHRRYADVMELALYNAVLSGVSLDGTRFFYENPLASSGAHHREEWFGCPCCPPNLARVIASIGGYMYSQRDNELALHLYAQSDATLHLDGQDVVLHQRSDYPWDGTVSLQVESATPAHFTLHLRLPGWCHTPRVTLNGEVLTLDSASDSGYLAISRTWQNGDSVELDLPMPIEQVYAHPAVRADIGSTTFQRGPLVFCFEQADHTVPLHQILAPTSAALSSRFDETLLGGVVALEGQAQAVSDKGWNDILYRTNPPEYTACAVRAIPYFAWDNRAAGPMTVWLHEPSRR